MKASNSWRADNYFHRDKRVCVRTCWIATWSTGFAWRYNAGATRVILARFRSGRFLTLVATNIAARGLDINDVQLIIQYEPLRDVEAYIHRSGRTGWAGNIGVDILLYEPRFSHGISKIERESGFKFEHISAPQPADVAESAGSEAASAISDVSDSVIPVFRPQVKQLLNLSGMPAVDFLAKALAKAVGYTDIKKRSLLSSMENCVTLLLQTGRSIYTPSYFNISMVITLFSTHRCNEGLVELANLTLVEGQFGEGK